MNTNFNNQNFDPLSELDSPDSMFEGYMRDTKSEILKMQVDLNNMSSTIFKGICMEIYLEYYKERNEIAYDFAKTSKLMTSGKEDKKNGIDLKEL